jgi:uncharacterized protein (DUF433 family)
MDTVCPDPTSASTGTTHRRRHPDLETSRHDRSSGQPSLAITSTGFQSFAAEMRRDLGPETLLEHILADRVILAAWRLQLVSQAESAAACGDGPDSELPPIGRAVLRAESSLETGLVLLEAARSACRTRWNVAASDPSKAGSSTHHLDEINQEDCLGDPVSELPDLSNEWPQVPGDDELCDPDDDQPADAPEPCWKGRLAYDDNISVSSPVVRGTWVTVRQVVSLIVDGWTWSDVLHTHPELTEDDIRACLAYTVEQDDGEL